MPEPGTDRSTGVLVVGSINQDHIVTADVFPAPGETVRGNGARSSIGGKGANQAVAAALAGAVAAIVGQVGDDDAGSAALDALRNHGVDTSLVRSRAGATTGSAWITVAEDDNKIIIVAGANAGWPAQWPTSDAVVTDALRHAAVVLCQLEIPLAVVRAAAYASTGRFVLNAAPAASLPDALLAACDVLVVNQHELAVVAGSHALSADEVRAAHSGLRERGVGAVVTTMGADGAVVSDDDGTYDIASPPARVIDTTGAGDAFTGVLCARLAGGSSLRDAVRWAAAAGSLAVRSAGTFESYPDAATLSETMREADAS